MALRRPFALGSSNGRPPRVLRGRAARCLIAVAGSAALLGGLPGGSAQGANQFTVERAPDSYGAIVTDTAGNGYLAWNHEANVSTDVPMFCKLVPGASKCAHPISLALPGGPEFASDDQPFPILGPPGVVWVVASRYIANDTVIWTSTNGGQTFSAPYDIPYIPNCPSAGPCQLSFSFTGLTNVDDMLPVTPSYAAYDGQLYKTTAGAPSVYWLEASNNSGLGFNLDNTNEILAGAAGVTEFTFENTGGGGVAGSALGLTSTGEVVEAYWLETSPPTLAYYYFRASNPNPISPQVGWSGPTVVGQGDVPRLADGADGLFMLSSDSVHAGAEPTAVDIRKYNPSTHAFGAPHALAHDPASTAYLFTGGGLGENSHTGELAAVWPRFSGNGASLMRLYLSTDGGARFSPAQYVATVADSYRAMDNARVAIADGGSGFLTFRDARGLEVANLSPIAAQYTTLKTNGKLVYVPVTCPAPKGTCKVEPKLTLGKGKTLLTLAAGKFTLAAGATKTLGVPLKAAGASLLASGHGHFNATLTILTHSSAGTQTTTAHVTVRR